MGDLNKFVDDWARHRLDDTWSASEFGAAEINDFAKGLLLMETQRGLVTMALLSLTIHLGVFLYGMVSPSDNGYHSVALTTHGLLMALSLHIALSARWLEEINVLNLLGMALLVVTGAALMLLAHRLNTLNAALIVGLATLFMAMPIMTWGIKESITVISLIYLLLTASSMSVEGRFDEKTLWTLQFLIIASAVIALVLIARNVGIRKHDIRSRFELDQSRRKMERLSNIDPLTGCWNRRFLNENFESIAIDARDQRKALELVLLDIDLFKGFNDTFGHQAGDEILCVLASTVKECLPNSAYVMRLGGDEFAILCAGENLAEQVKVGLDRLTEDRSLLERLNGQRVTVSMGMANSRVDAKASLDCLYQAADKSLYSSKRTSRGVPPVLTAQSRVVS